MPHLAPPILSPAARHPIVSEDLAAIHSAPLPWDRLDDKIVLISGANGLIGSYLAETLLYRNESTSAGIKILALVRNRDKAMRRFAPYAGRDDLEFVIGDVASVRPPGRVDVIIHAASNASPKYIGKDPVGTISANVLGTHNLLNLARESGAGRFLFVSSGEVYGRLPPGGAPVAEQDYGYMDPTDVRFTYGQSKRMGENMCAAWFAQYGIAATIARLGHTYGPGLALDDGRVFADFVADIVARRNIVLKSDGMAARPFCYLADAITGLFTILLKGEAGQAYNLVNSSQYRRIFELAEILVGLFPELGLRVIREIPTEASALARTPLNGNPADASKLAALGWKPVTDVSEGFRRTILSFEGTP